jgi:hypothetical protein
VGVDSLTTEQDYENQNPIMNRSSQILSTSYIACHNHGCILAKHQQVPRNRNPLVECCSPRSEVPLSFLTSSASSSPLLVNPRLKSSQELKNVLKDAEDWRAKRDFSQMIKKNIQIPSNYYISEHDFVNKRRLSNQEKRRVFFCDLKTPSERSQFSYIPRNSDNKLCESSLRKSCLKGPNRAQKCFHISGVLLSSTL